MYKNILVSALVNLGDVVLTTSALALIKKNFPSARITMLVKPVVADAVINNPVVDDVIVLDYRAKENSLSKMFSTVKNIRRRRFDLFISLDRKLRAALLAFLSRIPGRIGPSKVFDDKKSRVTALFTDVISIDHDLDQTLQARTYQTIVKKFFEIDGWAEPVFARITDDARANVDRLFERLPTARLKIALCVKGTFALKTYPKEYFAEIVRTLRAEYDAAFFIVGAPADREYAESFNGAPPPLPPTVAAPNRGSHAHPASAAPAHNKPSVGQKESANEIINFCGETSLIDLAEIFNRADLFITVDTGAAHIAATTKIPMVVMFGCTPTARWHPINPNAVALSSNEPCCPCSFKPEQCPSHPKPDCLYHVKPATVLDACRNLLEAHHELNR